MSHKTTSSGTHLRRKRFKDAFEGDLEILAVVLVPQEVNVLQSEVDALRKLLQTYKDETHAKNGTEVVGGYVTKEEENEE